MSVQLYLTLTHMSRLQFLVVLKLLVDRPDSPSEDVLESIELNQALLTLTKFVDRSNERSYLRVKIKFCTFCENALSRAEDVFGLRRDDVIRNNLVDAVADWIETPVCVLFEQWLRILTNLIVSRRITKKSTTIYGDCNKI